MERSGDLDVETITEGALGWKCGACESEWEVRTAFFRDRRDYDTDKFMVVVRESMVSQGMTQQTLAKLVGVSDSYISILLQGKRVPTRTTARRILEALGEHAAADSLWRHWGAAARPRSWATCAGLDGQGRGAGTRQRRDCI